jgi:hypothetical protein
MMCEVTILFRGARASRVLAIASSRSRTFHSAKIDTRKERCGETPQPARGTHALLNLMHTTIEFRAPLFFPRIYAS